MNKQTVSLTDFRFFFDKAGYVVGHRAQCAVDLARAEQSARMQDWHFAWSPDADCDVKGFRQNVEPAPVYRAGIPPEYWFAFSCFLLNADGETLTQQDEIVNPDDDYRRVVQAKLAQEVIGECEVTPQAVEQALRTTVRACLSRFGIQAEPVVDKIALFAMGTELGDLIREQLDNRIHRTK